MKVVFQWTYIKRFDSTTECIAHLRRKGFKSVVTSPHRKGKDSCYLHEADFQQHSKLAVWFGAEGPGISEEAVANAVSCVAVPMFGMVESLNLGTCTGIVLYEVTKQRREYQSLYVKKNKAVRRKTPLPTVLPLEDGR